MGGMGGGGCVNHVNLVNTGFQIYETSSGKLNLRISNYAMSTTVLTWRKGLKSSDCSESLRKGPNDTHLSDRIPNPSGRARMIHTCLTEFRIPPERPEWYTPVWQNSESLRKGPNDTHLSDRIPSPSGKARMIHTCLTEFRVRELPEGHRQRTWTFPEKSYTGHRRLG